MLSNHVVTWQTRPIFISSTFKDMQAERDLLQHVVFPRLEEALRAHHIVLEPIDLRQGVETIEIDAEDQRELVVLKVVLSEIQRSRPFLVVLLGDRYGWVPPTERLQQAKEEFAHTSASHDQSVTALEIEFGILSHHAYDTHPRCLIYLREPLPLAEMPTHLQAEYSDQFSSDPATRDRYQRLVALKQRLLADPDIAPRVHRYHAQWDAATKRVGGLEAWGDMVFQHLHAELQPEINAAAQQPPLTWEDLERSALQDFITQRARDFTGRQALLDELKQFAREVQPTDSWGIGLLGEPGTGKSAIFARFVLQLQSDASLVVLTNAAGATPRGANAYAMLTRFIQEMATALALPNPLASDTRSDVIEDTFATLLRDLAAQRRVVLALDALDQMEMAPLAWLQPRRWPANARLVLTCLAGPTAEVLREHPSIRARTVPPLTVIPEQTDDVTAIAEAIWRRYRRQVNPAVLQVLKSKRLPTGEFAAGNPLWLTLALEQLNLLDAEDFTRAERAFDGTPAERLRAMLIDTAKRMPPTVAELYGWLLAQNEKIYGASIVRAFVATITVSRFGWRETDLLALLPKIATLLNPQQPVRLRDLDLANLRRSFRAHLIRRGSLQQLDFFHAQMRDAATRFVLSDATQVRRVHLLIADYLDTLPTNDPVRERELLHHLIYADDQARAARRYGAADALPSMLNAANQALANYLATANRPEDAPPIRWVVGMLTQPDLTSIETGRIAHGFAFALYHLIHDRTMAHAFLIQMREALLTLIDAAPHEGELFALATILRFMTRNAITQGNLNDAKDHITEAITIQRRFIERVPENLVWRSEIATAYDWQGDIARLQGDSKAARVAYEESLRIRQELIANPERNRAWFTRIGYTPEVVERYLREQEIDDSPLHTSADATNDQLQYFEWELRQALSNSWEKLGLLAEAVGNHEGATRNYQEAMRVRSDIAEVWNQHERWERDRFVTMGELGTVALRQGNFAEAERYLQAAQTGFEKLVEADTAQSPWLRDLGAAYGHRAQVAEAQHRDADAQALYLKAFGIMKQLAHNDPTSAQTQRDLAVSLGQLGMIAHKQNQPSIALNYWREALQLRRRLTELDPTNATWWHELETLVASVYQLHHAEGQWDAARGLLVEICAIWDRLTALDAQRLDWAEARINAYNEFGNFMVKAGKPLEARSLFLTALAGWERLVAADPLNAAKRTHLAGFHYRLARLAATLGESVSQRNHLQACRTIFAYMDEHGIKREAQMEEFRLMCEHEIARSEARYITSDAEPTLPTAKKEHHWHEEVERALAAGRAAAVLDQLRNEVFLGHSTTMNPRAPLAKRIAFLRALALTQNIPALELQLTAIPEQNDIRVQSLSALLAKWRQALNWRQRLGLAAKPPLPAPATTLDWYEGSP